MLSPIQRTKTTRFCTNVLTWVLLLYLSLFSATSMAAFRLTPQQQAWLDEHPRISIGVNNAWPPMDYLDRNGKPAGIGVDFIEALNKRLGGRLQPIPGSWNEIYERNLYRRQGKAPACADGYHATPRPRSRFQLHLPIHPHSPPHFYPTECAPHWQSCRPEREDYRCRGRFLYHRKSG